MSNVPRVSVIVPNYNHARFLPRRIDSILSQTFQDFEIILLDDCSTDDSLDVLTRYARSQRVRLVRNETNSGSTFKQWNRGLAESRGEYVWLAESDDYAESCLLERLTGVLHDRPQVGVAYCQSIIVDERGNERAAFAEWTRDLDVAKWAEDFIASGSEICRNYLVHRNVIPNASAVVFRRSLATEVGGADESFRLTGDWKFWTDLLLRSDLAFVAEPLNFFRCHGSNVRSASRNNGMDVSESYRMIRYVAERSNASANKLSDSLQSLADAWATDVVYHRRGLRCAWRCYNFARQHDPQINARLIRRIGGYPLRWAARTTGKPRGN